MRTGGAIELLFGAMNSILASASQPVPNINSELCKSALIADKTLAYDATALLTAALKAHLIIQQQLLDFWEVFMVRPSCQ
jgi:hypothetical protein